MGRAPTTAKRTHQLAVDLLPSAPSGLDFIFSPPSNHIPGTVTFRLENEGPTGQTETHTSNRAELRAVIAALEFREWPVEGWMSLVIATDSEYVAFGATKWMGSWKRTNWRKSNGGLVKHRDLWKLLMKNITALNKRGVEVLFWRIPRTRNALADQLANEGATMPPREKYFVLFEFSFDLPSARLEASIRKAMQWFEAIPYFLLWIESSQHLIV
jgi:ribonuclease HI